MKHVVWFIKHQKYCGIDNEKAMKYLGPDEIEENVSKIKTKEEVGTYDLFFSYTITSVVFHCYVCGFISAKTNVPAFGL